MDQHKVVYLGPRNDLAMSVMRQRAPAGVEVAWVDPSQPPEKVLAACRDAEVIVAGGRAVTLDLARACPRLKLVQVFSAGTDWLDVKGLGELGVRVANNHGGNSVAVAEHAIVLMVAVYRRLAEQIRNVQERRWSGGVSLEDPRYHEIAGKTVGIVGLGHIGQAVARRLRGWEATLLYTDIRTFPKSLEKELGVKRVSLDELLRTSDIVTLHVPLNSRTRAMISHRELAMMKPTAVLINTCRGPVVDEKALYQALREGRIAGAGLDVLEEEPTPPNNPILDLDTVVVTPHLAGLSIEARTKSFAFAMENAARVIAGQEPISVVVPE